jgi:hypothetical protein
VCWICPVPEPILDQPRVMMSPASTLRCHSVYRSIAHRSSILRLPSARYAQAIDFGLCCADTSAVAVKLVTFITRLRADGDHEGEYGDSGDYGRAVIASD